MANTTDAYMSAKWAIQDCFDYIFKNLKEGTLTEEEIKSRKECLMDGIYDAIDEVEPDEIGVEDLSDWELEEELKERGYLVLQAPSLKERYKIDAFMQKLEADPYGPMIIL